MSNSDSNARAADARAPSLAAASALALAWTPLANLLPILGVLRGPLGPALVVCGALASAARWRSLTLATAFARLPAWGLPLLALLLHGALGLHYVRGIQASGDEVEYLLLAQSLWKEHDLDLADNFARGDHLEYTPGLGAMPFGTYRADGRPISTHSVGLPLLLAPAYALGGRSACVLLLALCAALVVVETERLARLVLGPPAAHWAGLIALGPPLCFYAFHAYSEAPTALLAVAALRLLLASPSSRNAALAALCAAGLPWLHVKAIPAAAVLGALALVRLRGKPLLVFCGLTGALALAYLGFYAWVYGEPTPLALYGSKLPRKVRRADPGSALAGLWLDGDAGLLPWAPVFLLVFAGLARVRTCWTSALGWLLTLTLALFLPLLAWQTWWAGHCPPARFFVPLVPLLAILAALPSERLGLGRWRGPLALGGLALAIWMSLQPRAHLLLNDHGQVPAVWEQLRGLTSWGRYVPLLMNDDPAESRIAVVWVLLLSLLLVLDRMSARAPQIARLFETPWFPLGLWLAFGALVDYWAR